MSKPGSFIIINNIKAFSIVDFRFIAMLVAKIASSLGLSTNYVALVARTASYRYKTYQIPKRADGFRTINHPARELKLIQRWLVKNLLASLPIHRSATAYKKGASVYRNASMHRMRNYLLKVDFKDFFPSIKGTDVSLLLKTNARLLHGLLSGPADVEVVRQFVCRRDELTIGAPSSPLMNGHGIAVRKGSSTRATQTIYFSRLTSRTSCKTSSSTSGGISAIAGLRHFKSMNTKQCLLLGREDDL
jgi:hypothetical protein